MRKLFVFVLAMLFAVNAFAAVGATKVSSNTVTVTHAIPVVVTFNTVINKILVLNDSGTSVVHVSFDNLGWQSDGTYLLPTFQTNSTVGAFVLDTNSSVSVDINTTKIGFWSSGAETEVNYLATTESGTQP